jgi:hypothetical protein
MIHENIQEDQPMLKRYRTGIAATTIWIGAVGMLALPDARAADAPIKSEPKIGAKVEAEISSPSTNSVVDALARQMTFVEALANGNDETGKPILDTSYKSSTLQMLARLQRNVEDKDYRNAVQTCDNIGGYPATTIFRKAIKDLSSLISAQMRNDFATSLSEVRTMLADLPAACASAKNLEELQALADRIQQAQNMLNRLASGSDTPLVYALRDSLSSASNMLREWSNLKASEETGDDARALEALNRITSMASGPWAGSPEIAKKQERLQAAIADKVDKAAADVRVALIKATTSKDLQTVRTDFNRQFNKLRRATGDDSYAQQQLETLRNVLNAWGRILSAEEQGDLPMAIQNLSAIENDYYGRNDPQIQSVVSTKRDALLRKLLDQPPRSGDDPFIKIVGDEMEKVDSLEKLIDLKRRILPLQYTFASARYGGSASQQEIQALVADIQILEALSGSAQGRPPNPYYSATGPSGSHRWKIVVNRYYTQIRLKSLTEMFELKDLSVAEGQTLDQALLQAADKAMADKQWERLSRCLDAYRGSVFGNQQPPTYLIDQISACRNFITARNLEKAGDFERAAVTYLSVLNAPAERSPVEEATREIARLRREHPEAFEKIRDLPLVSPSVTPDATPRAPTPTQIPAPKPIPTPIRRQGIE